jgi:hypothetical protein
MNKSKVSEVEDLNGDVIYALKRHLALEWRLRCVNVITSRAVINLRYFDSSRRDFLKNSVTRLASAACDSKIHGNFLFFVFVTDAKIASTIIKII